MIKIVTAAQMRALDNRAIKEMGVAELVLMENAGLAVLKTIQDNFKNLAGLKVSVFAGKGNNGGDGIVTARH
ncbi:MAG TPA: bifunctional ADP-dependent NAD(P)H-hydrate dehydratase/NAD(P)H-hydrate epimerase, partial [Nitrospirae bacterium]|nr:bifunctional ADP-dependent NAD(P)H-hydrate dehydratase/NAD(P)H-hydrate epimerase [Nitrospirota bacterium]